jgi:glyoxylate reductase
VADSPLPKVFIARPPEGDALNRLQGVCDVEVWAEQRPLTKVELIEHARDVEGILTSVSDLIDEEVLSACPKLRVVSNMAVGFDNFSVPEMTKHGVVGGNTPGVLTEATADIAFALILASARRVVEANEALLAGAWTSWNASFMLGLELAGSTIGIVGAGRIGLAVARRAQAFSMRVLATSRTERAIPNIEFVSLERLLVESDVVSIHVSLTEESRGLIGKREFDLMKPSAIFVNTARGAIVVQSALAEALREGTIAGAGLDVFEKEPLPLDDPIVTAPHVVLLPHIGSATTVTRTRMGELAVDNLIAGIAGERLLHCVNPEVYV